MRDIDQIRRDNLKTLEEESNGASAAAKLLEMSPAQFTNLRAGAKDSKTGKSRGMRKETARRIESAFGKPMGWLDQDHSGDVELQSVAPAPHEDPAGNGDLVITEFDAGGGMGTNGRLLLEDQPGVIRSWNVSADWLHLNVPSYSSLKNLCIVTGFGPSMRPMFNPGDPLLVDRGVRTVNHEGIYFFRVGDEGFIKIVQRVPEFEGPGFVYRIISKNPDYPPYDISAKNQHFQVIGKVLTVWRSEQF